MQCTLRNSADDNNDAEEVPGYPVLPPVAHQRVDEIDCNGSQEIPIGHVRNSCGLFMLERLLWDRGRPAARPRLRLGLPPRWKFRTAEDRGGKAVAAWKVVINHFINISNKIKNP